MYWSLQSQCTLVNSKVVTNNALFGDALNVTCIRDGGRRGTSGHPDGVCRRNRGVSSEHAVGTLLGFDGGTKNVAIHR